MQDGGSTDSDKQSILKIEIKVSDGENKELIIDREVDDLDHKVKVFCAINGLSEAQERKLKAVISQNLD